MGAIYRKAGHPGTIRPPARLHRQMDITDPSQAVIFDHLRGKNRANNHCKLLILIYFLLTLQKAALPSNPLKSRHISLYPAPNLARL
jgi:hypothetical protein